MSVGGLDVGGRVAVRRTLGLCCELSPLYSSMLLIHFSRQALFPGNTYRHDSGGDPTQIPGLKFEEFQEFHAKYYHPSNARWKGGAQCAALS